MTGSGGTHRCGAARSAGGVGYIRHRSIIVISAKSYTPAILGNKSNWIPRGQPACPGDRGARSGTPAERTTRCATARREQLKPAAKLGFSAAPWYPGPMRPGSRSKASPSIPWNALRRRWKWCVAWAEPPWQGGRRQDHTPRCEGVPPIKLAGLGRRTGSARRAALVRHAVPCW